MKFIWIAVVLVLLFGCVENQTIQSQNDQLSLQLSDSFSALVAALNNNDFIMIKPYLADDYIVNDIPASMSRTVLQQVIESYDRKIDKFELLEIESHEQQYQVTAVFYINGKKNGYEFILNKAGLFVEIDIFKATQKVLNKASEQNLKIPIFMEVPFELTANLIIVDAEINESQGKFIVDSGAPGLILNKTHFSQGTAKTVVGSGVSGTITGSNLIHVDRFTWQEMSVKNFEAISIDLSHLEEEMELEILGLIGYAELEYFEIMYDYQAQKMLCFKTDDDGSKIAQTNLAKPLHIVDFRMTSHIPVFKVLVGDKEFRFGLDTGSETNLLSEDLHADLIHLIEETTIDTLLGADKIKQPVKSGTISNCRIGEKDFNHMKFVFSNISHLNAGYGIHIDGLIGYEFLSRQRTAVNYKKKQIYLW